MQPLRRMRPACDLGGVTMNSRERSSIPTLFRSSVTICWTTAGRFSAGPHRWYLWRQGIWRWPFGLSPTGGCWTFRRFGRSMKGWSRTACSLPGGRWRTAWAASALVGWWPPGRAVCSPAVREPAAETGSVFKADSTKGRLCFQSQGRRTTPTSGRPR